MSSRQVVVMLRTVSNGRRRVGCLCLWLCSLIASGVLFADQKAAELPGLFEQLQSASNPADVASIESEIWQHWLTAPDDNSALLMSQLNHAMASRELSIALLLSNQLVDSTPEFAEGWNKRATIHYLMGDNDASVADIRETVLLEPRHFGAISGLGLILLRAGNQEAALEAFEKVLAISPGSPSANASVERVRRELGREI